MKEDNKKEKLITLSYIILCFAYFAAQFGYSMSSSNISKYARSIGVGDYIMGILPGLMSFAALLSRPLAGWISDHVDRKKMMLVSLLSLAVIFVAYRFSTNTPMLLAVRIIHGVVFAVFSTVNMAFIADAVTGNGSGSYTFNTWQAEENVCHNTDLIAEVQAEFGELKNTSAEALDVSIRCWMLGQVFDEVLQEVCDEMRAAAVGE